MFRRFGSISANNANLSRAEWHDHWSITMTLGKIAPNLPSIKRREVKNVNTAGLDEVHFVFKIDGIPL